MTKISQIGIDANLLMTKNRQPIGAKWDTSSSSPALTRINQYGSTITATTADFNNHTIWGGMRRCNLSDAGVVNAYYGDASFADDGTNGQVSISYRGVENFWGNVWKWVDGINIKADRNPWIANHDFASDTFTHPYVDTGLTNGATSGYVIKIGFGAGLDYGFLASDVTAGSDSTYLCDYYYQATGNRAALFGGYWNSASIAGAFHWYLNSVASDVYSYNGARCQFK